MVSQSPLIDLLFASDAPLIRLWCTSDLLVAKDLSPTIISIDCNSSRNVAVTDYWQVFLFQCNPTRNIHCRNPCHTFFRASRLFNSMPRSALRESNTKKQHRLTTEQSKRSVPRSNTQYSTNHSDSTNVQIYCAIRTIVKVVYSHTSLGGNARKALIPPLHNGPPRAPIADKHLLFWKSFVSPLVPRTLIAEANLICLNK